MQNTENNRFAIWNWNNKIKNIYVCLQYPVYNIFSLIGYAARRDRQYLVYNRASIIFLIIQDLHSEAHSVLYDLSPLFWLHASPLWSTDVFVVLKQLYTAQYNT